MANFNQEPTPQINIEELLFHNIEPEQMLQFTQDGVRIFGYAETGETKIKIASTGETGHIFKVPVKEPYLQKEAQNLPELFADEEEETYENYDEGSNKITSEGFVEWKSSLTSPEDIIRAAAKVVDERQESGDEETVTCRNCKGEMHFESGCLCTMGGITFNDLTDGRSAQLRETGVADPDCQTCEGTGKRTSDCPNCSGCGYAAKYPQIIIINEETGESRTLKLDIAALVAAGEMDITQIGYQNFYTEGEFAEEFLNFEVSGYIGKQLADMGIDKENAARYGEDGMRGVGDVELNSRCLVGQWRKKDGQELEVSRTRMRWTPEGLKAEEEPSPEELVKNMQINLAHQFSWPYGKIKDANGAAVADEWRIRPLRPIEDTLEDLKTAIITNTEGKCTLGFTEAFIATGEVGPSFFILSKDGDAVAQLSVNYRVREALENAWLTYQKHINRSEQQ